MRFTLKLILAATLALAIGVVTFTYRQLQSDQVVRDLAGKPNGQQTWQEHQEMVRRAGTEDVLRRP